MYPWNNRQPSGLRMEKPLHRGFFGPSQGSGLYVKGTCRRKGPSKVEQKRARRHNRRSR